MKIEVTVTIDAGLLEALDQLVKKGIYDSRSAALEAAIVLLLGSRANDRPPRSSTVNEGG